jgi:hypothetical protein
MGQTDFGSPKKQLRVRVSRSPLGAAFLLGG